MNLNKVTLIGNLTREPQQRSLPTGQVLAAFGLATNFFWKDAKTGEKKSTTEFHDIVAWGRLAEICLQYLKKGSKVYIEGRLRTRSWKGDDGKKRSKTEIVAENLIMLGHRTPKKEEEQSAKENAELASVSPNLEETRVEATA